MWLHEGRQPLDPHTQIESAAYGKPAARLSLRVARSELQLLVESLSAASGPVVVAAAVVDIVVAPAAVGSLVGCRACLKVLAAGEVSQTTPL